MASDLSPQYRRVMLGVRAHRLAVLINSNSTWRHCLQLVELLTSVWGGSTFAVIPSDGNAIPPVFWGLIKRHDPDWFVAYRQQGVSKNLADRLLRHSVADPFGQFVHPIWDQPGFPLTPIDEIMQVSGAEAPDSVVALQVDGDDLSRLLILSSVGILGDRVRERLERRPVEIVDRTLTIGAAEGIFDPTSEMWEPFTGSSGTYPFRLTTLRLGSYTGALGPREHAAIGVCGSTVEDFALFWTLRVLRGGPFVANVFWLPLEMKDSARIGKADSPTLQYWQRSAIENTGGPGRGQLLQNHVLTGQQQLGAGRVGVFAAELPGPLPDHRAGAGVEHPGP
jgi:hypothetical protein